LFSYSSPHPKNFKKKQKNYRPRRFLKNGSNLLQTDLTLCPAPASYGFQWSVFGFRLEPPRSEIFVADEGAGATFSCQAEGSEASRFWRFFGRLRLPQNDKKIDIALSGSAAWFS
jgi:hypothetical protein